MTIRLTSTQLLNTAEDLILCLDVGMTKIEGIYFSLLERRVIDGFKVPTADLASLGTASFAEELLYFVQSRIAGCQYVGLSLRGLVKENRLVFSSLVGGFCEFDWQSRCEDLLGIKTLIDDDIHPLALAEKRFGKACNKDCFAVLSLGTGVGVAVYDGKLLRGKAGAGLIGKSKRFLPGLQRHVSWDQLLGGQGLSELHAERTKQNKSAADIFAAVATDQNCRETVDFYLFSLSALLQEISYYFNPEVIIIAGSVRKSLGVHLDQLIATYNQEINQHFKSQLELSELDFPNCLGVAAQIRELVGSP